MGTAKSSGGRSTGWVAKMSVCTDMRHSAMTAAAEHGATLATLMHMAGHSTSNAAQRYQHATAEHARKVAAAIDATAAALLSQGERLG